MTFGKIITFSLLVFSLATLTSCEVLEEDPGYGDDDRYDYAFDVCSKTNDTGDCEPYEAEDHSGTSGCEKATKHAGYSGSGFMDFGGNGTWIEWNNIAAPIAGKYTLTIRYANGSSGNRQGAIIVNGREAGNVPFSKTGSWKVWKTATFEVSLKKGNNTIRVKANTGSGGANLDNMLVVGEDLVEDNCPSDPNKTEPGLCGCGTPEGSCSNGDNIALGKATSQSSTAYKGESSRAVDGNTSGRWGDGSITHTASENQPWWQVDLGAAYRVQSVTLFNRTDCCSNRLSDFVVDLLDQSHKVIATEHHQGQAGARIDLKIAGTGVFSVRVSLRGTNPLSLAEVQVFGSPDTVGDTLCVEARERNSATLYCPSGESISSIDFASYGLPTGSCETSFNKGSCHASSSESKVEAACLAKQSCTVAASNGTFGDPCPGKGKKLSIVFSCSGNEGDDETDLCPADPRKTEPGICGCGVPEGTCDDDQLSPGLIRKYYRGQWSALPDFEALVPDRVDISDTVSLGRYDNDDSFGLVFTGTIEIDTPGRYDFELASDDGSLIMIDGDVVVDHDGTHGFTPRVGSIDLSQGSHDIRVEYFEQGGGDNLRLRYRTSGESLVEVPADVLFHTGETDDPDDLDLDCREYQDPNGKVVKLDASGGNDTDNIHNALKVLGPGDTLELSGHFHYTRTIYIPNGVSWILNGSITLKDPANPNKNLTNDLDMVGYKKFNSSGKRIFDNNRRSGIVVAGSEENSSRARICMMGGTYYGEANTHIDWEYYEKTGKRPTRIRLLNFIWIKDSLFLDMNVEDASDDCFTLGSQSKGNRVVRVTGKHAGGQKELDNDFSKKVMGGNGLSDYGDSNKWYDCIAEYNGSDGFTPKCKNSEFHRCIARFNNGPGWGAYARLDGTLIAYTQGTEIDNNRFVDIVAHNNETEGISMNISENCKPQATIRNNYISGIFYENKHVGVFFRNKAADGIVEDNEVHAIIYDNESKSALGGGLSTDAKPSIGAFVVGLTGTVVAFDNENDDVDLSTAKDSAVTLYHPSGTTISAEEGNSSYDNDVSIQEFSCSSPDADVCQEYCAR